MGFFLDFYSFSEQKANYIDDNPEDILEIINAEDYEGYHSNLSPSVLSLLLGSEFAAEDFRPSNIDDDDYDECAYLIDCADLIEDIDIDGSGVLFNDVIATNNWINAITKDDLKKRFESDICKDYADSDFEEVWGDFNKLRLFFNKATEEGHAIVSLFGC
jgi:hypothetical protein